MVTDIAPILTKIVR